MKKTKKILAALGVVLLLGMYLSTLIFALIHSPFTLECLKISIGLTILIPVLLWIYLSMYRYMDQKRKDSNASPTEYEEG